MTLDKGWNKQYSGESYDIPLGFLHVTGVKPENIIYDVIYKTKCRICNMMEYVSDYTEIDKMSNDKILEAKHKVDSL